LNRFAAEIRNRLCNFTAHDLKKNEILRVATVYDAAQILTEMEAVLRDREQSATESSEDLLPVPSPSAEEIFAHMSAYMETANP
jgi:hypothetical protein